MTSDFQRKEKIKILETDRELERCQVIRNLMKEREILASDIISERDKKYDEYQAARIKVDTLRDSYHDARDDVENFYKTGNMSVFKQSCPNEMHDTLIEFDRETLELKKGILDS